MKKLVIGFIVGFIFATAGAVYADEGLQKVEAYLRPTLPITLDSKPVTLESSPIMYDGSTYLKLRDLSKLTGLQVNWNDATQTVELGSTTKGVTPMAVTSTTPTDTTYNGLRAIILNGETYFSLFDYNKKFDPYLWGFDKDSNIIFLTETEKGTNITKRKLVEIKKDDAISFTIYNGESYVNVKHYSQP
jgi:hypothetical protein